MEAEVLNKKKTLSPKLRFKGFGETFKDSKIGDFVLELKGGASLKPSDFTAEPGCEVVPKKAIVAGGKLVLDNQDRSFCTSGFFNSNTNNVIDKSFLLTTLRDLVPSAPSIGFIVQYDNHNKYILAQGVYAIKIDQKKLDKEFLIQFSNSDKYRTIMKTIKVGSTQVHIRNKDFFNVQLFTPTIPEQQKIASFLSAVDEKIQQLNHKKELLEQYKKGVMQQLFSGKLRFKPDPSKASGDENGKAFPKWEEFIIGELFKFKQGVQAAVEEQLFEQHINYVRFIRIVDLTKNDEPIRFIKDPGQEHHVKKDDLFMVRYGNPGVIGFGYKGVIANNLFRIIPTDNRTHNSFFKYWFEYVKKDLDALASSSTMPALNFSSLNTLKLKLPFIEEQKKIANYLSNIDNKIESVTNQITQTQTFKKGLLQQMFV